MAVLGPDNVSHEQFVPGVPDYVIHRFEKLLSVDASTSGIAWLDGVSILFLLFLVGGHRRQCIGAEEHLDVFSAASYIK